MRKSDLRNAKSARQASGASMGDHKVTEAAGTKAARAHQAGRVSADGAPIATRVAHSGGMESESGLPMERVECWAHWPNCARNWLPILANHEPVCPCPAVHAAHTAVP